MTTQRFLYGTLFVSVFIAGCDSGSGPVTSQTSNYEVGEESSAGEALRAHLGTCSICAEAFERLQAGQSWANALPIVEPPAKLDDRVMAAARTAVGETRTKVLPAAGEQAPAEVIPLFRRVLRSGATSQMAVAAALLLMVSVGYFGMDFQTSPADLAEPPLGPRPRAARLQKQTTSRSPAGPTRRRSWHPPSPPRSPTRIWMTT